MAGVAAGKVVSPFGLGQRLWNAWSAWSIRNAGYQKLGLRREDLYSDEIPEFVEAVRRLPENEKHLRTYRVKRAMDLEMKHRILPKEQWTTPEEDILYLAPYIRQVQFEMSEKKKWKAL